MPYYAAPNCASRDAVYRFPADEERRRRWKINCRRDQWTPTQSSRLCEKHFEANQFERKRIDGRVKLKPNAIPTLFDVPNPPRELECTRRILKRSIPVSTEVTETDCNDRVDLLDEIQIVGESPNLNQKASCEDCARLKQELELLQGQCREKDAEIARLKSQLNMNSDTTERMEKVIGRFLNEDQIQVLKREGQASGYKWSDDTIMSALKIRFSSGKHGYEYLRKSSYPLPSYRTLCERVVSLKFAAGIQYIVLDWIAKKVDSLLDWDRNCILALDEMQLSESVEFDTGLKSFVGYVSPEFRSGEREKFASHALCFMLKGLATKWKQVIAYYFTGNSVSGVQLWEVTKILINELGRRGMFVAAVVSDMAPSNQAMWRSANIKTGRNQVSSVVDHLYLAGAKLCFLADVPPQQTLDVQLTSGGIAGRTSGYFRPLPPWSGFVDN